MAKESDDKFLSFMAPKFFKKLVKDVKNQTNQHLLTRKEFEPYFQEIKSLHCDNPDLIEELERITILFLSLLCFESFFRNRSNRSFLKKPITNKDYIKKVLKYTSNKYQISIPIPERIKLPFNLDKMIELLNEPIFITIKKDNTFFEKSFHSVMRQVYRKHEPNSYWHDYRSFLKITYRHFEEYFSNPLDLDNISKFDLENMINYRRKKVRPLLIEIFKVETIDS